MKRTVCLMTAIILAGAPFAVAGMRDKNVDFDMAVDFRMLRPSKQEDWNSASGVEVQARFWNQSKVGVALACGADWWQAKTEFTEDWDELGNYYAMYLSGKATLVPVGISALYRPVCAEHMSVIFHAGFRYVIADSSISTKTTIDDVQGVSIYHDPIKVGNGLVGLVGLGIEGEIDEGFWFRAGIGYQFDVVAPHETYLGDDIGSTSFSAAMITLGLGWSF